MSQSQEWYQHVTRPKGGIVQVYGNIIHKGRRQIVSVSLMADGRLILTIGVIAGNLIRRPLTEDDGILKVLAQTFLDRPEEHMPLIDWLADSPEFAAAMRGEGEVLQSDGPMLGAAL